MTRERKRYLDKMAADIGEFNFDSLESVEDGYEPEI